MKEKGLHDKLRAWAYETYGEIDPVKNTGLLKIVKQTMLAQYGEAGQPDWAVYVKAPTRCGYTFFIELKNPEGTGEVSDIQIHRHNQLREMGFKVFVVDDFAIGKQIIRNEVNRALGRPLKNPRRHPMSW